MLTRRLIVPLIAAAIAIPVLAQSRTLTEPPRQDAARWADISFPGGSLSEYLATLQSAFGATNAAITPGLESIPIGPIEMKSAGLADAMNAIAVLSSVRIRAVPDGPLLWQIIPTEAPAKSTLFRVWPMAEILSEIQPEVALSAVQTALDLVGPGAEVKFHSDSKLLIVKGTPDQIDAAAQVVDRLETNAQFERSKDNPESEAQRKLREANQTIQRLQARIAGLEADLARRN